LALLMLLAGGVFAQERSLLNFTGVFAETGFTGMHFKEELTAPVKSTETGVLPMVRVGVANRNPDARLYYRGSVTLAAGGTHYDGTDQTGTIPLSSTTQNVRTTSELNVGAQFGRVAFYTGLGYLHWERNLGGQNGYGEKYAWLYLPVGVRVRYAAPRVRGTVDLSMRPTLRGNVAIDVADMFDYAPLDAKDLTLSNRTGVRLEAPVHFTPRPRLTISLSPWYEYATSGGSDTQAVTANGNIVTFADANGRRFTQYLREPASRTHQYGATLGVSYAL
jgi:hypothetical protein